VISRNGRLSMSKAFAVRATLLALSTLVLVSAAQGDTQSRTHVTIRGTGENVAIERDEAPTRKRLSEETVILASPLGEAVRLKAQGASDRTVISYLRAHEAELPPVVGLEDVKQLREAGAGKSVVAYLTTVAAVEIGETGEGPEAAVSRAPISAMDLETAPYGMSDGYPILVGYGAPRPPRLSHRGFTNLRRMPSGPPSFHRSIPSRAPFSRHLTNGTGKRLARD
jgi:hypothetical protein